MLPRSSAISSPLTVLVEVLSSSVLLVLRKLKSITSTAAEFTLERTHTLKVSKPLCFTHCQCTERYRCCLMTQILRRVELDDAD
jgi:hypothetical protein